MKKFIITLLKMISYCAFMLLTSFAIAMLLEINIREGSGTMALTTLGVAMIPLAFLILCYAMEADERKSRKERLKEKKQLIEELQYKAGIKKTNYILIYSLLSIVLMISVTISSVKLVSNYKDMKAAQVIVLSSLETINKDNALFRNTIYEKVSDDIFVYEGYVENTDESVKYESHYFSVEMKRIDGKFYVLASRVS